MSFDDILRQRRAAHESQLKEQERLAAATEQAQVRAAAAEEARKQAILSSQGFRQARLYAADERFLNAIRQYGEMVVRVSRAKRMGVSFFQPLTLHRTENTDSESSNRQYVEISMRLHFRGSRGRWLMDNQLVLQVRFFANGLIKCEGLQNPVDTLERVLQFLADTIIKERVLDIR